MSAKWTSSLFENYITMPELLDMLKQQYSKHSVYRWVQQGMPHKHLGGKLWFHKEEVLQWLERRFS